MAGGMNKRGGIPLGERRRPGSAAPVAAPPFDAPPFDACPVRHCWVADAADGRGTKRPGLLSGDARPRAAGRAGSRTPRRCARGSGHWSRSGGPPTSWRPGERPPNLRET